MVWRLAPCVFLTVLWIKQIQKQTTEDAAKQKRETGAIHGSAGPIVTFDQYILKSDGCRYNPSNATTDFTLSFLKPYAWWKTEGAGAWRRYPSGSLGSRILKLFFALRPWGVWRIIPWCPNTFSLSSTPTDHQRCGQEEERASNAFYNQWRSMSHSKIATKTNRTSSCFLFARPYAAHMPHNKDTCRSSHTSSHATPSAFSRPPSVVLPFLPKFYFLSSFIHISSFCYS